jgi:hypothetical protein
MKFYSLMKEHENDLARIMVSPCIFIVEACLHSGQTLENGKTLAEAKVGANRRSVLSVNTPCDGHH